MCLGSTNAFQADLGLRRCRHMRWARGRLRQLGHGCFVDEWTLDHPVVHAHESYAFLGGREGYSWHSYFQREPRVRVSNGDGTGARLVDLSAVDGLRINATAWPSLPPRMAYDNSSLFRGNSEAMMLQILLALAAERRVVDASRWSQDPAAKTRVRSHCPKLFGGQFALNFFHKPGDVSGVDP